MASMKNKLAPTAEIITIPRCDTTDPADLATWYGNFGFDERYRKVVLANATELVRARAALVEASVSEARLKDLARLEQVYLDYLAQGLIGRKKYEREMGEARAAV